MKYRVGDKVVLKFDESWIPEAKSAIENLPGRIATIKEIDDDSEYDYWMVEISYGWEEDEIEGLASEIEELASEITTEDPVSRFDLLDFD